MKQLLLLHGFSGAPESWRAVREYLGSGYQIFAPALLGHRGTEEPPAETKSQAESPKFDQELERIVLWLEHNDYRRGTVVGYSLGGRVALGLLCRFPKLFTSAVIVGAHPGLATPAARTERRLEDERRIEALLRRGLDGFLDEWESQPLFASQRRLSRDTRARQTAIRRQQTAQGLAASLRVCGLSRMPNYRERLTEVACPIAFVVGQQDTKFIEVAIEMQHHAPNSHLCLIEHCGHNPLIEQPARLAQIITASAR